MSMEGLAIGRARQIHVRHRILRVRRALPDSRQVTPACSKEEASLTHALDQLSIGLVGLGAVGHSTLRALGRAGVRDVHLIRAHSDPVDAGRTWSFAELSVHLYDSADSWLANCQLCIAAVDVPDAVSLLGLNARCLRLGVAFLAGLAMGKVGQVGPIVRGGMGPCLCCVDLRLRSATRRSCLAAYGAADPQAADLLGVALAGRAAQFGDPEASRYLTYHWADGAVTSHPVLRTHHCSACAGVHPQPTYRQKASFFFQERPPSDPRHILNLRDRIVDSVTGPITSLQIYDPASRDPALTHCVVTLVDEGWQQVGQPLLSCGGAALNPREAEAAALGEALERASAVLPSDETVLAKYDDVKAEAVDPCAWDLFDRATRAEPGFPYAAPSRSEVTNWVWGWSVTSSRPTLVPAARVFLSTPIHCLGGQAEYPLVSGFATGNTLEEATLSGLLEVIERDSFMIAWANRLSLRHATFSSSACGASVYAAAFERPGLEARCGVIELDLGAPVAIAMVRSTRLGDPALAVAAAANADPQRACRRALSELATNRLYVRHLLSEGDEELAQLSVDEVRDGRAHGLLFARPDMASEAAFWWERTETLAPFEPEQSTSVYAQLFSLLNAVNRAGLEVLVVDLTPPEIRELGLRTVKVLVPGTYPMNFDSRWAQFGGDRITEAPVRAGLRSRPLPIRDLNRLPHPFP
jgi:ribosomal protein S12 methylthiotransferase accessory factor